uniref:SecY-independent transporter protein n=1 Tax=Melosira undulata TaxID=2133757 RepID=A0A3G1PWE9_9STRA|nr:SecY-independent transporter protein [Melosira undulata]AVR57563.1 SecY-independent transporter protein [Melosira undulata]
MLFFLKSGLYVIEFKKIKNFLLLTILTFLFFGNFIYFYIVPLCWMFLYSYNILNFQVNLKIIFELKLHDYLIFILYFFKLWFIISTMITITIYFFYIKKYNLNKIKKNKKLVFFTIFCLAAFITPPDLISQLIIGIYFVIIFEIFILILLFFNNINSVTN